MGSAAEETEAAARTEEVARRYFAAVAARDPAGMAACWRPGGIDVLHGQARLVAPHDIRDWFSALFAAFPDAGVEVLSTTADADRCAVRWRLTATFAGPGSFSGFAPNGARVDIEAVDVVQVADGLIVANDAYLDGAEVARQLGVLPPRDSRPERTMAHLANAGTKVGRRLAAAAPERIADGVWLVRGGLPGHTMNVYLIEDEGGVVVFDAGVVQMTRAIASAGARLGGISRVVLGHGHKDHRGVAPGLGVPVFCHADERADAEGDGGLRYADVSKLALHGRVSLPMLLKRWDGGPVAIEGALAEGDSVAGFRVIHLPGHAPGLIGLWRESDRLALVTDCFYTLDPQTGRKGRARVPHAAFNWDSAMAADSMRKLAELDPLVAWPGHAEPIRGDVARTLRAAADAGAEGA